MLQREFCICKCYYWKNIFLKEYDIHFVYKNASQFKNDYLQILKSRGWTDIKAIDSKLKNEIELRKNELSDSYSRRALIKASYSHLHPSIFSGLVNFLHPSFISLSTDARNGADLKNNSSIKQLAGRLYSFPVFNNEFCDKLIEEIKHFEASSLPKRRPNTMNRYGVNVDEIGLESILTELRTVYLSPITEYFFPDWGGGSLDSHKAFVVKYKEGEDVDLSYHYDNAEVTLNVSLNADFTDGELYFGPMRFEDSSLRYGYEHEKGNGILHRGQQMHGALPISEGERYNLIIWMRSSEVRNKCCPMCDEEPDLEPVKQGTGDGFTRIVHDFCVAS